MSLQTSLRKITTTTRDVFIAALDSIVYDVSSLSQRHRRDNDVDVETTMTGGPVLGMISNHMILNRDFNQSV